MTKLSRPIEQWRNCNPRSMATEQSAVAAEYAFADAKHDILMLHAQREELLAVCRMATMLRQLGGMLPGSREIVQSIVEAADKAIANAAGDTK